MSFSNDEDYKERSSTPELSDASHHRTTTTAAPSHYSVRELVDTLNNTSILHNTASPELSRRVMDFRLAQRQRQAQSTGGSVKHGILGLYHHLATVRLDLEWAEDAAWRRVHGRPYLSWTDFEKSRRKNDIMPIFTYGLIALCTILMVLEFAMGKWQMAGLKENPMFGPTAAALIASGARQTEKIVQDGEWYRLLTPLLLHAGIIHYVVNMLALYFIGGAVERNHGTMNTVWLFLLPGVGGNILSAIFLPHYISVGASGGIFGLIGGCVADITLNWPLLFIQSENDEEEDERTKRRHVSAVFWLVLEIIVNVVIGMTV